jgi:hypothetical protein
VREAGRTEAALAAGGYVESGRGARAAAKRACGIVQGAPAVVEARRFFEAEVAMARGAVGVFGFRVLRSDLARRENSCAEHLVVAALLCAARPGAPARCRREGEPPSNVALSPENGEVNASVGRLHGPCSQTPHPSFDIAFFADGALVPPTHKRLMFAGGSSGVGARHRTTPAARHVAYRRPEQLSRAGTRVLAQEARRGLLVVSHALTVIRAFGSMGSRSRHGLSLVVPSAL